MRMLTLMISAMSLAGATVLTGQPAGAMPAAPLAVAQPDAMVAVQWGGRHWGGRGVGVGRGWAGPGVGRAWAGPRVGGWAGRRAWGGRGYGGYPAYGYRRPYYGGYGYRNPGYGYGYGYPNGYGYAYPGYGYGYGYDPGAAAMAGIIGLATGAIVSNALRAPRTTYRTSSVVRYCAQRYRSYDPVSRTFRGRDGRRHRCG